MATSTLAGSFPCFGLFASEHLHFCSAVDELFDDRAADVACSTCYENLHLVSFAFVTFEVDLQPHNVRYKRRWCECRRCTVGTKAVLRGCNTQLL